MVERRKKMQKQLAIILITENLILILLDAIFIYYLIKHQSFAEKLLGIKDVLEGKVANVIAGAILIYICVRYTIPSIMDAPYLIQNQYRVVEGIAENNSVGGSNRGVSRPHGVNIRNDERESVSVYIYGACGDISIGDELTVKYLPHTHYGCVVEHKPAK